MMDYVALGKRIRDRRHALKLNMRQLAEMADISDSFLGHIERGSRVASLETFMNLCYALKASPNELLGTEAMLFCGELPERLTVSPDALLQGVAELLRREQFSR